MNATMMKTCLGIACAGAGLAIIATDVASAQQTRSADPEVRLTVAAAHYAVGTTHFDNVASVAGWLQSHDRRVVAIERCASAGAPRVLAAVERFYPAERSTVELRTAEASASACAPRLSNPRDLIGFLRAEDYLVTDEAGHSALP